MSQEQKLLIASNRLPVVVRESTPDLVEVTPSSGGLVTAMAPLLRERGGTWVGWPGVEVSPAVRVALAQQSAVLGHELAPVALPADVAEAYYEGFSNGILWPLFHDLVGRSEFCPGTFEAYAEANRLFARAIDEAAGDGDHVWIHDYHLMLTARKLRASRPSMRMSFFLHIPFPPPDLFAKLPWRDELLAGLLDHDTIGLQTQRDLDNFMQCVASSCPGIEIAAADGECLLTRGGRSIRVGAFPIGIDFDEFAGAAARPEVEECVARLRSQYRGKSLICGIDRLDYSKGIPHRLEAFRELLRVSPELAGTLSLVQVVVPSRDTLAHYRALKWEIERMVGAINGEFGTPTWMPVHYVYRSLSRTQLLALYRAADVALVTPLKDGMNLVAKEFCASRVDDDGALVLSEFAGAAGQLRAGAVFVNPFDVLGTAAGLRQALTMEPAERRDRMRRMRAIVAAEDVHRWSAHFLASTTVSSPAGSRARTPELTGGIAEIAVAPALAQRGTSGPSTEHFSGL